MSPLIQRTRSPRQCRIFAESHTPLQRRSVYLRGLPLFHTCAPPLSARRRPSLHEHARHRPPQPLHYGHPLEEQPRRRHPPSYLAFGLRADRRRRPLGSALVLQRRGAKAPGYVDGGDTATR